MKIENRQPGVTADISAHRNGTFRELVTLISLAIFSIAVLYYAVGVIVDLAVSRIDVEQEIALFEKFSLAGIPDADRPADDAQAVDRVQRIVDQLRQHPDVPPINYRVVIIERDDPNAFAFPGGIIGVTTGLLEAVSGDVELAFVLGHELGHFHNRDQLAGLGRSIGFGICYTLLFGGEGSADTFSPIFATILQSHHSREQESKADRFGMRVLFETYDTTEGFDRVFEVIKDRQHAPRWAQMFATHPVADDRAEALQQYAEELRVRRKSSRAASNT